MNKQLQYTYWPIAQEVKTIRQWNLVSQWNAKWETFLLKNPAQNAVEKLFPDPFLKTQNWVYVCINRLKKYTVCFHCMLIWGLLKYRKTRPQTTCFYLITYIKLFYKAKSGLELVCLPVSFLHDFWRKIFHLLYSINSPNLIVLLPLIHDILSNVCIVSLC